MRIGTLILSGQVIAPILNFANCYINMFYQSKELGRIHFLWVHFTIPLWSNEAEAETKPPKAPKSSIMVDLLLFLGFCACSFDWIISNNAIHIIWISILLLTSLVNDFHQILSLCASNYDSNNDSLPSENQPSVIRVLSPLGCWFELLQCYIPWAALEDIWSLLRVQKDSQWTRSGSSAAWKVDGVVLWWDQSSRHGQLW